MFSDYQKVLPVEDRMTFQLSEEPVATLSEQANVPIAFEYDRMLALTVAENGLGGFVLNERDLATPQIKDYDTVDEDRPANWAKRFDVSNWGFIVARSNQRRVGGAVIAFDTVGVDMLERRRDLAVLWDIRVEPAFRHHGVGAALFQATERWAASRGCKQLKIETQNINLAACKFYARQGCRLGIVNRFAYPDLPEEVQLVWYKDLIAATH